MSTSGARGGLLTNVATAALPLVGSFLVSLLLAPYVGDAGFGVYSLVMTVATFLLIVAKFGVHAATSRLVSEHDDAPGPWIRAGLALRIPFTLVVAVIAVAAGPAFAAWLTESDTSTVAFRLAGAVVLGASLFEFGTDLLVGLRAFRAQFALRASALALRIAALLLVRFFDLGVAWFLVGHAVAQLLPAFVVLGRWLTATRGQTAPDGSKPLRRTWEIALPLAFSSASFLIYAHTDRIMLGAFHDEAVVGQFAVARNVIDAALFPVVALTWTLRPALVRARREASGAATRAVLADGMRLSIVYAVSGGVLIGLLGPVLVQGLYGAEFAPASGLMRWMVPLLVLRGLGTVVFPALVAADAQGRYARLMGWTAAVNALANLVLIPRFAAEGAVASTVLALALLTLLGFREVRRATGTLPGPELRGPALRALLGATVVGAVILVSDVASQGAIAAAIVALVATAVLLAANVGPRGRGLRIGSEDHRGA